MKLSKTRKLRGSEAENAVGEVEVGACARAGRSRPDFQTKPCRKFRLGQDHLLRAGTHQAIFMAQMMRRKVRPP